MDRRRTADSPSAGKLRIARQITSHMTKKPSREEEADKQDHPSPSPASDELILPKPKPDIRPLSETELEKLETALGKPVSMFGG